MREAGGPHLARDPHDLASNDRAGHSRSEQVLATVHGAGPQGRPDEVRDEIGPDIDDVTPDGPRSRGPRFDAFQVLEALADIDHYALHLGVVVLDEPGHGDGGIQPAGIGERDPGGSSHVSSPGRSRRRHHLGFQLQPA